MESVTNTERLRWTTQSFLKELIKAQKEHEKVPFMTPYDMVLCEAAYCAIKRLSNYNETGILEIDKDTLKFFGDYIEAFESAMNESICLHSVFE